MVKRLFVGCLGIAFSFSVYAQPVRPDIRLFRTGKNLIQKGMFYEAMLEFKKAIRVNRNFDSAYIEWADLYLRINKPDSAIYVWNQAVYGNPKMVYAYAALGKIYRDNKFMYDSARNNYLKALKLDSTNKENLYGVAWCFNALKDFENAILYATKALDKDPNYRAPFNELAHAIRNSRKFDEGLEIFKKYAAISTSEQPLFYSGLIYMETERYDKLQETIDELNKKGAKSSADGLVKRWDAKKKAKTAEGPSN